MIHPTAIIHPGAQLHESVRVGPYSVIDEHVTVGAGCELAPHVHLTGHTTIGAENRFHAGCVIGDAPQDLKYSCEPTRLIIGERNLFREHVTIHRSNTPSEDTRIGSENFFMANSHVGHNSIIGNKAILANGVLIAGHAMIGDGAFLAGNAVVHQFCRVGA
ncbi:MAG: acyl-[acyl-carrier-protein]--UDP-N-acetylglucosamine O-acyltransferase, partial [Verrucomicrobia bacterium]|nr:acyl-[acyl-carrier-protein]--UDP-N-acetylglucosamine O-acyltransferase [Verrucomicrobiota bacterium]